jgi:hypothetical protein
MSALSAKSREGQFLQYERLGLAKTLASAVLQFHATPLLRNSWSGDDVVFFGMDAGSKSLTSPHLIVRVGYDNAPEEKVISNQSCKPSIDHHFIRNRYLHSLGVILIELAHQAPLSSFRGDENSPDSREGMDTDFFVADRVAKSMSTSLGPSYAKVVRKCLGCDFGEGTTNLNDLGLQAAFYRDVVCELERLEREFMKMQLGP